MAIDFTTYKVVPEDEAGKKELIFRLNAFKTTDSYDGFPALATKLRDLLLMEAGTHPGAIGMGIGIRNYMTDLADDITLQALTDATESQIKQYLPTSDIKSVEYKVNTVEGDRNKLYLVVYLNETADEFQSRMFALGINDSLVRKKDVISDIYM